VVAGASASPVASAAAGFNSICNSEIGLPGAWLGAGLVSLCAAAAPAIAIKIALAVAMRMFSTATSVPDYTGQYGTGGVTLK
jgi:hypothetical protein